MQCVLYSCYYCFVVIVVITIIYAVNSFASIIVYTIERDQRITMQLSKTLNGMSDRMCEHESRKKITLCSPLSLFQTTEITFHSIFIYTVTSTHTRIVCRSRCFAIGKRTANLYSSVHKFCYQIYSRERRRRKRKKKQIIMKILSASTKMYDCLQIVCSIKK